MLLYLRESLSLMSQRQSIRRGIQESCPWSSWVRDLNPRFVNLVPGRLSNETSVIFIMRSSFVQLWNIKYPELIVWRKQWLKNYREYKLFSNVWKDGGTNYFLMVGKKISAKYYFLKESLPFSRHDYKHHLAQKKTDWWHFVYRSPSSSTGFRA